MFRIILVVSVLGMAGCVASPSADTVESQAQVADGRAIAERECATCHALDKASASPRADAPPMRELLARYDKDALANDLIEGIKLGHQDMPQFDFNVIAADSLVAYLRSIQSE
jgi:mono/diheme cytochrome c family protein